MGVLTGGCMIGLAKAQGVQMTEKSAAMTLVPLFWSCLHLLVNYRMTCTDPKLASFGFGLVADVMIVLAFYELRVCCLASRLRLCWRSLPQWRSPCRCRISAATVWLC